MPKLALRTIIFIVISFLWFLFPSNSCCAQVVINEFLVNPNPEWVEFHNFSDSADYLREYYLDDDLDFSSDSGSTGKKILTNLDISNIAYPFFDLSSFLNNDGDYVVLFRPDGSVVDAYQYTSNPGEGITMGRSPDGRGGFVLLATSTKGAPNPSPTPSPTSTPTPTPTPSPTSTPTSTLTTTPTQVLAMTKTPTPTAKKTVSPSETVSNEETVLGLRNELVTQGPMATAVAQDAQKKFPLLPVILIVLGIALVGGSGFVLFKKIRQDNITQGEQENNDGQID